VSDVRADREERSFHDEKSGLMRKGDRVNFSRHTGEREKARTEGAVVTVWLTWFKNENYSLDHLHERKGTGHFLMALKNLRPSASLRWIPVPGSEFQVHRSQGFAGIAERKLVAASDGFSRCGPSRPLA
jgi:hypothetical protein